MTFFIQIIEIFNRPFPYDEWKTYLRNSIILSVFVTFFLFIFEPFGINTLDSNKLIVCIGFGVMTLVATLIYDLILFRLLKLRGKRENWTLGKWLLHTLGIMLLISLANFLFARFLVIGTIDWSLFPTMIYGTFMIGIIPVFMLSVFALFNEDRKFKVIANEIDVLKKDALTATETVANSIFGIQINQIKYVEALQNYIKIVYINELDEAKVKTERMTLKEFLSLTEKSSITRCHRSFLVNKDAIVSVSGNAQGLLLSLSNCEQKIPVSRTLVPQFTDRCPFERRC